MIHSWKKVHLFVVLGFVLSLQTAWAQESGGLKTDFSARADSFQWAVRDMQARLQDLQAQLDALRSHEPTSATVVDETMLAGRGNAIYLPPKQTPVSLADLSAAETPSIIKDSQVEISGFLDAVYTASPRDGRENKAAFNQIELDLARSLNEQTAVSLSLCYDESFLLGGAIISYAVVQPADESPRFLSSWTATAGQFDIPFGLDYLTYTSISRETVTMPQSVAGTHGGWNDLGLLNSITTSVGSLDLYAVKGFESQVWTGEEQVPADVTDDDDRWAVSTPSVSGGARLNFTVLPGCEFGCSSARGWEDGRPAHSLGGVHAGFHSGFFSLKTEGIYLRRGQITRPENVRGGYAECKETLGKLYLIQRFDLVENRRDGTRCYAAAGAGIHVNDYLVGRVEYRAETSTASPNIFIQIAAGF